MNCFLNTFFIGFIFQVSAKVSPEIIEAVIGESDVKTLALLDCNNDYATTFGLLKKLMRSSHLFTLKVYKIKDEVDRSSFLESKGYNQQVILDIDCSESETILTALSDKKTLNGSYSILAFGTDWDNSLEILGRQNINYDSKVLFIFDRSDQVTDHFEIFDIYSLEHLRGTPLNIDLIGNYSTNQGVVLRSRHSLIKDFKQHRLMITTNIPKTPHGEILLEYIKGVGAPYQDNMNRLGNRILILISEFYNFKIHWIRSTSWGYVIDKNYTFDGCIGTLQSNQAHACACSLVYTITRMREIHSGFSVPLFRQMFIFRHPRSGKYVGGLGNIFLRPLSTAVWLSLAAICTLATIVLYITHHYDDNSTTISELFVTAIGILSNQGISVTLISAHTRIAALLFIFLAFILFNFYSASIVGSLLTPPQRNLRDMERLMNSNIKIILQDIPSSIPVFQFIALGREFYEKRLAGREVMLKMEDGLSLVQKGGYAFFAYVDTAYFIIKTNFTADEMDDLIEIRFYQRKIDERMYFPVKKYSWFREPIKIGVQTIAETGLGHFWKKKWMLSPPVGNLDSLKMVPVDLAHFSTVLYMMLGGIAISIIIFIMEHILKNAKKKKMKKTIKVRHLQ